VEGGSDSFVSLESRIFGSRKYTAFPLLSDLQVFLR